MSALKVDPDSLKSLAHALEGEAETIYALEPSAALGSVAGAMPSSAVGGVAGRAGAPLDTAYRAMANCLRRMAEATEAAARNYEVAEEEFGRQLAAVGSDFEGTAP
ncbi:type VII secretion target [Rhodococcus pyridinivorans]|uniref:type VII secretion target n=1 Tax=Rhodococcus TaxID=1827 RepID=UPI002164E69E|nr:type VII secretion target [Rhodococcus pyridinivorans]UVT23320.1 type VII secretion target [Rhodococcus pyridinivorans]